MRGLRWLTRGLLISSLAMWLAVPVLSQSTPYGVNAAAGHTLDVDGARIYYERYGSGPVVVLLHGGLFGYIDEFSGLIEDLRRDHTVIAIALRGHGRSTMGNEPLSHQRFADDAAAVIHREAKGPVDVVGFSSGAMAAYRLVISNPALVRRLIAIGGPIAASGSTEAGAAEAEVYSTPDELERLYPALVAKRKRLYADSRDWERLVRAFAEISKEPDIPESAMQSIVQPTLIVAGDRDYYTRLEHFVDIYRLLSRGSLSIVPGCGHVVLACEPRQMFQLIREFLRRSMD